MKYRTIFVPNYYKKSGYCDIENRKNELSYTYIIIFKKV